jgi:hypothetical protein
MHLASLRGGGLQTAKKASPKGQRPEGRCGVGATRPKTQKHARCSTALRAQSQITGHPEAGSPKSEVLPGAAFFGTCLRPGHTPDITAS